jgi:hypothetical protein
MESSVRSVVSACHVAHLDDVTGCGVLVRPRPSEDVACPFPGPSLHEADRRAVLHFLDDQGWEPIEDVDQDPGCVEGYTADGRQVIGLYGRNPLRSTVDVDELAESFAELHRRAGVLPA